MSDLEIRNMLMRMEFFPLSKYVLSLLVSDAQQGSKRDEVTYGSEDRVGLRNPT